MNTSLPEREAVQSVFKTRVLRLVTQFQRDTVAQLAQNVPAGVEVVFREPVKQRGLDQNGYYWLRLTEIADQAWIQGRQYSKEVWHEYARQNLMPDMVTTKDGSEVSKWLPSPDGKPVVISTTQLEKRCFAQYTEIVEAHGAGMGVMFSVNPNDDR